MNVERGRLGRYPFAAVGGGDPVLVLAGLAPTTGVRATARSAARSGR